MPVLGAATACLRDLHTGCGWSVTGLHDALAQCIMLHEQRRTAQATTSRLPLHVRHVQVRFGDSSRTFGTVSLIMATDALAEALR